MTEDHFTRSVWPELSNPFCESFIAWISSSAFSPYFVQRDSTRSSSCSNDRQQAFPNMWAAIERGDESAVCTALEGKDPRRKLATGAGQLSLGSAADDNKGGASRGQSAFDDRGVLKLAR